MRGEIVTVSAARRQHGGSGAEISYQRILVQKASKNFNSGEHNNISVLSKYTMFHDTCFPSVEVRNLTRMVILEERYRKSMGPQGYWLR